MKSVFRACVAKLISVWPELKRTPPKASVARSAGLIENAKFLVLMVIVAQKLLSTTT